MSIDEIIKELDAEIVRLQEAKQLLSGLSGNGSSPGTRRQKAAAVGKKRRVLSAEARQRIAEAQRKRWAAKKRVAK